MEQSTTIKGLNKITQSFCVGPLPGLTGLRQIALLSCILLYDISAEIKLAANTMKSHEFWHSGQQEKRREVKQDYADDSI